jgi:hypothetical protein
VQLLGEQSSEMQEGQMDFCFDLAMTLVGEGIRESGGARGQ